MSSYEIMDTNNEVWIRTVMLPKVVNEHFNKQNDNRSVIDCSVKRLSMEEGFMLTMCYRVTVTIGNLAEPKSSNNDVVKLVVKITPELDDFMYNDADFKSLFNNEITAYTEVFPVLKWTDKYPKYYYSHNNERDAAIALGDFNIDGWSMSKSLFNLSLDHILAAVKQLGQFHGGAYSLKNKNKQIFSEIIHKFEEARFKKDAILSNWGLMLKSGPQRALKASRQLSPNIPKRFIDELAKVINDPYQYQKKNTKPLEPLAVLCHGDYVRNNIAFKYNENNEAIDAMMFDFQTLRYSSPMVDLVTFMAVSTGADVRSKHFNDIFQTYFNALESTYKTMANEEIPEYLSHDNLLREYAIYTPYGLTISSSFIMFLYEPMIESWVDQIDQSEEVVLELIMSRGGELVDRELASQVQEIYEWHKKWNINLS